MKKVSRPYSPELKGHIERNQGTILHSFFETCPGFIGHSVSEREAIRSRHSFAALRGERRNEVRLYRVELTGAQLQQRLDDWLAFVYAKRAHAGLLGNTPDEIFSEAVARGEVQFIDERALDLLLSESGQCRVLEKGLHIGRQKFWNDELVAFRGHIVQFVRTRDIGRVSVFICDESRPRFLCTAISPEICGLDMQIVALTGRAAERRYMQGQMAALRAARRKFRKPEQIALSIIESAAATAAARISVSESSNVLALPFRNDQIEAALTAVDALAAEPAAPVPHDPEVLAEGERILRELDSRPLSDDAF